MASTPRLRTLLRRLVRLAPARPTTERPAAPTAPPRARRPRRRTRARSVQVSYTPNLDGDADPGEVVWAWVPYEDDPSQGKDRPVVIVGRRGTTLVGVALTSQRRDREAQVAVGRGAWDREGRTSYARVERLVELDHAAVRREGAVLDRTRFDRVVDAIERLHDVRR